MSRTAYTVGFYFSGTLGHVLLINKLRPSWQAGKLNGIGGKIEPGESPVEAMVREFKEEAGIATAAAGWLKFCALTGDLPSPFTVHFFAYWSGLDYIEFKEITNPHNDEKVSPRRVESLWNEVGRGTVPNLRWLIPMALNVLESREPCQEFDIVEARVER